VIRKLVGLGLVACVVFLASTGATRADDSYFRDSVAPVLEQRCIHCHGGAAPKGKLSLATAAAVLKGGESGPAVVPGKPDESVLLEMISGDRPQMPQKDKPLAKQEVERIRTWIERGAHWPENLTLKDRRFEGQRWWAFEPLERPAVPSVSDAQWPRNPIDRFVLAGLAHHGLKPSAEADRRVLIRRLYFDLLGLPPRPEEVEAFVDDCDPAAYEHLVDRALASPHYGERWARHWLDVVHYGDTHGYDKDKRRDHAWPYRDFVIKAFNDDRAFGRFVREQVAGDVLDRGDPRGVIATGFIAAGPWDFVGHAELREGTVDKLKTRLLDRDDMVSNTMSTFVSMTVHCARCHDHKFDPITQRDYYRLQAVFAGVDRGDRPYASPALAKRRSALDARHRAVLDRSIRLAERIARVASPALAGIDEQLNGLRLRLHDLRRPLSDRASPSNGYHSAIHPRPDEPAWVQLDLGMTVPIDEIRVVPARPTDFPDTPGFGLPPRFRVEVSDDPLFRRAERVAVAIRPDKPNADDEPYVIRPGARPARYVRVTATRLWKRVEEFVFALAEVEVISDGVNRALGAKVTALDSIEAGLWARKNLVDGFDSRCARPAEGDAAARLRHALLYGIIETERERACLAESLADPSLRVERDGTLAELEEIDAQIQSLRKDPLVYAVVPHAPRPISVLKRGDVEQPGEPAQPGTLQCLPGLPADLAVADRNDEGSRRAALAEWIASPRNMLTWRAIANRLWQYHFGRGIVETPNDFGRNGAQPTHPELLDWLAISLLENGQSLKALHRLIVCSAVYRQSSRGNPAFESIDAENRFLWRQNRRRLDAETVRDSVLMVSGTLDRRMGGPGFELFAFKDDHSPVYDHTDPATVDNPQVRRRTIYRFTVRSVPNPFMEALDCADPNLNTPVRSQTLTALQALALWNDLFMVRQSHELARRLEESSNNLRGQVVALYRLALSRDPRDQELAALAAYAAEHGLANACRLLWNTNEFVFVD
jgi:Protein of unknown function (DUF1553)/Protein of unknown function (DUF1549)/Planctomycete cytochrome C